MGNLDNVHLILLSSALVFASMATAALWVVPAWDSYTRSYIADLAPRLDALSLDESGRKSLFRWWGLALFATALGVGIFLAMPPIAIGLTYIVFIAPRLLLDRLIAQRKTLLRDQMVRASASLANSARAGLSLQQGIEQVAGETLPPLQNELKAIVHNYKGGMPLKDALRRVERKLDIEAFTVFTSAILVCLERGGRVTFALDRISTGLLEMQRLERKMEADTAAGRKLATILAAFPLFFLLLFAVLDPLATQFLFNTLPGQFILLAVGATVYVAIRWCMSILDVDF